MADTGGKRQLYRCSFCGKSPAQVKQVIAGPGEVHICNECVELCHGILTKNEQGRSGAVPGKGWVASSGSSKAESAVQAGRPSFSGQPRGSFDRFTDRAREVLKLAEFEARSFNHNYIGTEHLLLGLVREGEGVAAKVLASLGVELTRVRSALQFIIGRGERQVVGEIDLTPRARKIIELAADESRRLGHQYIGTEHLLLGLIREGEGIAAIVLESLGVNLEKARRVVMAVLTGAPAPGANPVENHLCFFCGQPVGTGTPGTARIVMPDEVIAGVRLVVDQPFFHTETTDMASGADQKVGLSRFRRVWRCHPTCLQQYNPPDWNPPAWFLQHIAGDDEGDESPARTAPGEPG